MAKNSVVNRNNKRTAMAEQYAKKRAELKAMWLRPGGSPKSRESAFTLLQKLPRDSARVRVRNRCAFTGPPARSVSALWRVADNAARHGDERRGAGCDQVQLVSAMTMNNQRSKLQ